MKTAVAFAVALALGAAALPAMEKRETDWAYFCNDAGGTDCGEGVAMSTAGCNLYEPGRASLLYNQNAAEYYLGVFTDSGCSSLITTYDINPNAVASANQATISLNPSNTYYGFCADASCADVLPS